MTPRDRTRHLDEAVFERHISDLKVHNTVAGWNFDDASAIDGSPSKSHHRSPKPVSHRSREPSFGTNASLDRHGKEEAAGDFVKRAANSAIGANDKPALSPNKAWHQNTAEGDYGTVGLQTRKEKISEFTGDKKIYDRSEDHKYGGRSLLNAESKREQVSKSDEEEMLHLSESSTPEKSKMGEAGSRTNIVSPKRRKRLKNGVVETHYPFRRNRLSEDVTDILSGNIPSLKEAHDQQEHTRELKRLRGGATVQHLGGVGHKEDPLPQLSGSVEHVQKGQVGITGEGVVDICDRLSSRVPKNLSYWMSFEPGWDTTITIPRVDIPGPKRSKGEERQRKDSDGDVRDAADPLVPLTSASDAISQEIKRPRLRKVSTTIREDNAGHQDLSIFQEKHCGGPWESERLKQNGRLGGLAQSKDDASILSRSVNRRETTESGIEESPKRSSKRRKSKRRPRSVPKESSSQEPISPAGAGYAISKEGWHASQKLRQKLLVLSSTSNTNAVSSRPATRNSSPRSGEALPRGVCLQPESLLHDCNSAEQEQAAGSSRKRQSKREYLAHELVEEDSEALTEPTTNRNVGRNLQETGGGVASSKMSQGTEREARSSIETSEGTCGSSPVKSRVSKKGKRRARRQRLRAMDQGLNQKPRTKQGSNMSEISEASLAEKPQRREEHNASMARKQLKGLEPKDDAEVGDVSGSRSDPVRVLKRRVTAPVLRAKPGGNAQIKSDEVNLSERSTAHNAREGKPCEFVQIEDGNSSLKGFGSTQNDAAEPRTKTSNMRSSVPENGEETSKELSLNDSCSLHLKSETLEETQRHEAEQKDRQCSESSSEQPENNVMQGEKHDGTRSSPGDMSHRNRSSVLKRRKSNNVEKMPLLLQFPPFQEQSKRLTPKNVSKARASESPVIMSAHKGHSEARSGVRSPTLNVSENDSRQPAITQFCETPVEQRSTSVPRTNRLPNTFLDADEVKEKLHQDSVSNLAPKAIEDTALRERRRTGGEETCPHRRNDLEDGLALEREPGDGALPRLSKEEKCRNETEDLDLESVDPATTSIPQNLDDQLDPNKLNEQAKLLTIRSRRSRRTSRLRGTQQEKSTKAIDEPSDKEDSKDKAQITRTSSGTQQQSRTTRKHAVEPFRTHPMKTRGRGSTFECAPFKVPAIIDLTDLTDDDTTVVDVRATDDNDEIAESLKELQKLSLEDKMKSLNERPRCKFLTPLSKDESKLATDLTTRTKRDTKIVAIAEAGITLCGESFKRLRGTRWLDDEVLNAYVSLINSRNDAIFREMDEEHRGGIPRTYVFNTYFFTRLCSGSSGFDYPGVKGWTKRAKVDILKSDIILIPINLGNHHWVLSGVDMEHKEVMYLDSMHGPDTADAFSKLKRWVFEELRHKHGEDIALKLDPHSWKQVKNSYRIRRVGVLPAKIEPRDSVAGRMSQVPRQGDSGSCGVFTAKIADCLSLGTKVYFTQKHIRLIRRRMALDLFNGYVPL